MTDNIFEVSNVTLRRNDNVVLTDVDLSIERGEVLVFIGPSGSGKSSLLRCLNRLERIERGRILFNGHDITSLSVLELRRQVGMVFQKTAVIEGTIAENISYGPQLRGERLSRTEIISLMRQAALEPELVDRNARALSGGQEQRLAIARALANRPTVLLLDEPTSALDPIGTRKVEEVLLRLREEVGLTLVWVSHNVEQARRVADRVLLLEAGRVARIASVAGMLDEENGDPRALAFAQGIEADISREEQI